MSDLREQASALLKPYIIDRWQLTQCLDALQPLFDQVARERDLVPLKPGSPSPEWLQLLAEHRALVRERDDLRAKLTQAEALAREALREWEAHELVHGQRFRQVRDLRAALDRSVTP